MSPPAIAALVPMRHQSERVPGKNYRQVAGRPLFAYILETLLQVPEIGEVLVDTDSPILHTAIPERFPTVHLLERPSHLRDGRVPMNAVIAHDLAFTQADLILQTHSTNPLLRPETIRSALHVWDAAQSDHDSLFSVTRWNRRLWSADGRPLNHDPAVLVRTQDLSPTFEENSCLYLFPRSTFARHGNRIGERPYLFEMDREEAFDLDEARDLAWLEVRLQNPEPRPAAKSP